MKVKDINKLINLSTRSHLVQLAMDKEMLIPHAVSGLTIHGAPGGTAWQPFAKGPTIDWYLAKAEGTS